VATRLYVSLSPGAVAVGPTTVDDTSACLLGLWQQAPPQLTPCQPEAGACLLGCGDMCHVSPGRPCHHPEVVFFGNFLTGIFFLTIHSSRWSFVSKIPSKKDRKKSHIRATGPRPNCFNSDFPSIVMFS
jgi:hypothetical protein